MIRGANRGPGDGHPCRGLKLALNLRVLFVCVQILRGCCSLLFVIIGVFVAVIMLLVSLIIGALEHRFKVDAEPEGPAFIDDTLPPELSLIVFDMICEPGVVDVGLSTSIIATWDEGVFIENI